MAGEGWVHWHERSGSEALHTFAAEAAELFDRLCDSVAIPLDLSKSLRETCASSIRLTPLETTHLEYLRSSPVRSPLTNLASDEQPATRTVTTQFAEQFAIDVSSIDDRLRSGFISETGETTFGAIQTIWVADMGPRVRSLLDNVFAGSVWGAGASIVVSDRDLWATIDEFIRVVHNIKQLDPVLSEVVRLRGAREHDCRLCKSLRSQAALVAGADEDLFDSIDSDGQGELSERARVATALVDAFIWHPADISEDLISRVRSQFEPAQAVELILDIMRNAANKIAVALGADAPNVTEGTEVYEIDDDGVAHYGLDAPHV